MVSKYSFLVLFLTILVRTIHCVPINNVQFNVNSESSIKNSQDYDGFHDENSSRKIDNAVPVQNDVSTEEFEKHLNNFLEWYYENYIKPRSYTVYQHKRLNHVRNGEKKPENEGYSSAEEIVDPHDVMQSDQPATMKNLAFDEENGKHQLFNQFYPLHVNLSALVNNNITQYPDGDNNFTSYGKYTRERDKEAWLKYIQDNILIKIGRNNTTMPSKGDEKGISLNLRDLVEGMRTPNTAEEDVTEKIRSYYPSCEIPKNTDQEVWNNENTMNLYFNVEHETKGNGVTIATATLRLYRLPNDNVSAVLDSSCENSSVGPDEKLLRISIYWYTKSLKRHRVKRRLSDSRVIDENAKWVELSVRPATKAWSKEGKNWGLAVVVEDQDGTVLKADKYFKGASCTVGTSTPKPIPTVIVDAARWANELERSNGNAGGNATAALPNHLSLLPTIDICTLEYPQNMSSYDSTRMNSLRRCVLKKSHAQAPCRHIRHHRQHLQEIARDPRSSFINTTVVYTSEQLRNNVRLAQKNFTNINR